MNKVLLIVWMCRCMLIIGSITALYQLYTNEHFFYPPPGDLPTLAPFFVWLSMTPLIAAIYWYSEWLNAFA